MWKTYAPIMKKRMEAAAASNCDAFEYDNDGFWDQDERHLYKTEDLIRYQLEYNVWLATTALSLGKGSFLKNVSRLAPALEPFFNGVISESCIQFDECIGYKAFTDAGKPILAVDYEGDFDTICSKARELNFDQLVYDNVNLGHWRKCPPYTKSNANIIAKEVTLQNIPATPTVLSSNYVKVAEVVEPTTTADTVDEVVFASKKMKKMNKIKAHSRKKNMLPLMHP
jgi:hypothetical protein